jgi:hypothetical protein
VGQSSCRCGIDHAPPLQVCPSKSPLDRKDFNPIDYINELFPNEQVCVWLGWV